jgi:4-hydroxy-tetrahydrodipicolinate reductase
LSGGNAVTTLQRIVRMHPEVAPQWPTLSGGRRWGAILDVDGDLIIHNEFTLRMPSHESGSEASCLATAQRAVHAISYVCVAEPGPKTFLDLPPIIASTKGVAG